ncbi:citrate synthase [Azorhizobium sp. AG788]|uniref:citrate synthase family protein n=1 Tax=Azorhizobium sp. AG788 TaxID=2183897 RepID=UPI00106076CE|nr:citrate synthase family protein [Azorhizobium sp. AG788]TDT92600.1 citrate synthase [Azorhizobium sp. AG788]
MVQRIGAEEAARRLGVSRQTLYAYVSRGLLKAHPDEDPRRSFYLAEEVDRLARARRRGRRPKEIARSTLDWGMPVLESALTLIEGGRLYFRGRDATELAESATLEEVAALLWQVPLEIAFPTVLPPASPAFEALLPLMADRPASESLLPLFAALADDAATAAWRADRDAEARGCGTLVRQLAAAALRRPTGAQPLYLQMAEAYGLSEAGAQLVRRALVLCADHELNASGFSARCVASTGASLKAAVIGGLAALSGYRHGSTTARVEAFWSDLGTGDPTNRIRQRLERGEDVPGFGHPLYPAGDIRAKALLGASVAGLDRGREIAARVEDLTGRPPSVDFALVAVRRALSLPEGTAFLLFALGRSVGWIAHAREQRETQALIRPRALYTGPRP